MPTYVYKFVDTGETIEVQQAFTDDSLSQYTHPDSGELMPVKKVFQPVGVTFKGSGFFKTDNRGTSTSSDSGSNESKSSDSTSTSGSDSSSTTSGSKSDSSSSSKSSTSASKASAASSSD